VWVDARPLAVNSASRPAPEQSRRGAFARPLRAGVRHPCPRTAPPVRGLRPRRRAGAPGDGASRRPRASGPGRGGGPPPPTTPCHPSHDRPGRRSPSPWRRPAPGRRRPGAPCGSPPRRRPRPGRVAALIRGDGAIAGLAEHAELRPPRPRGGVEQPEDDRVVEGLPAGLDDVLRHPDGGPDDLPVGGVDQDPGDRAGALARIEHAHPVVGQVDGAEHGNRGPMAAAQRGVERVDRAVALGRGHNALGAHVHLDRGLGGHARGAGGPLRLLPVVGDDPEGLDGEEVRRPIRWPAQQQLERAVGHLEVVALVLERFSSSSTRRAPRRRARGRARPPSWPGRAPGHLRDDDAGAVARPSSGTTCS
jgi:hypothetical protein